jgi:hypothetical protein
MRRALAPERGGLVRIGRGNMDQWRGM